MDNKAITVLVRDENASGKIFLETAVGFASTEVTARDIIESRVRQEVERYNEKLPEYYHGLIEPTDAETTLNGMKLRTHQLIDAEQQVYVALHAFQNNGFFILVDKEQLSTLEQTVKLEADTKISFLKLTPLVGG